jgi:hypothetical protein
MAFQILIEEKLSSVTCFSGRIGKNHQFNSWRKSNKDQK